MVKNYKGYKNYNIYMLFVAFLSSTVYVKFKSSQLEIDTKVNSHVNVFTFLLYFL